MKKWKMKKKWKKGKKEKKKKKWKNEKIEKFPMKNEKYNQSSDVFRQEIFFIQFF